MEKEKIEQAAMDYVEQYYPDCHPLKKHDISLFIQGARWRIDSVWHSTDELPERSGFLAVLMDNGLMETMYYSVGIGFHETRLKGYASWAYIIDLLPERKEETKWQKQ